MGPKELGTSFTYTCSKQIPLNYRQIKRWIVEFKIFQPYFFRPPLALTTPLNGLAGGRTPFIVMIKIEYYELER